MLTKTREERNMDKKTAKAIRLVNGFTDDLRVKLPYNWRSEAPQQRKIFWFIERHLLDIYGVGVYEKIGTKFNPSPNVDAEDYRKVLAFVEAETRKVCMSETEV
jgi:hypothetical protein